MKSKKWFGYTIYGILVTVLFLYVLFPSHRVAGYIESVVSERNPDVNLTIGSADISFPLGLSCENVVLKLKGKADSEIEADMVRGRLSLLRLLKGDFAVLVTAETYGGTIDGRLDSPDRFSSGSITADMTFEDIQLGDCSYLKDTAGRNIEGRLGGILLYEGSLHDVISGEGNASFSLYDGMIGLQKDMFGFDSLAFEKAEGKMILKNKIVALDALKIEGKEMKSTLTGRIFLNRNFPQSRLALKGNVDIEALGRNLSVNVRGTISKPLSNVR